MASQIRYAALAVLVLVVAQLAVCDAQLTVKDVVRLYSSCNSLPGCTPGKCKLGGRRGSQALCSQCLPGWVTIRGTCRCSPRTGIAPNVPIQTIPPVAQWCRPCPVGYKAGRRSTPYNTRCIKA